MRVRPFFWWLFTLTCIGVLIFAAQYPSHVPAVIQVSLDHRLLVSTDPTEIKLHLTDPQGLPLNSARISSVARMTNMDMMTRQQASRIIGQGKYITQLHLYMADPWEITVTAHASGFQSPTQTLLVKVPS